MVILHIDYPDCARLFLPWRVSLMLKYRLEYESIWVYQIDGVFTCSISL